jgi:hypothetical protein
VFSLAGVDADGPGAAMAAPLTAPSGACCSLRLDGEPALPTLVDAECAAPEDARTPTAGSGRRWTAGRRRRPRPGRPRRRRPWTATEIAANWGRGIGEGTEELEKQSRGEEKKP